MPSPSKSRCEPLTSSGAALISLVVMTCAQTCGPPRAMSARSLFRFLMPAWTPAILIPGTAPSPPRTAISRTASTDGNAASDKSAFLRESEHNIHILHGLTGSTFTEIVQSADDVNDSAALRDRELRVVGHLQRRQIGNARVVEHGDERTRGIVADELREELVALQRRRRHEVDIGEDPAPKRHDVRR